MSFIDKGLVGGCAAIGLVWLITRPNESLLDLVSCVSVFAISYFSSLYVEKVAFRKAFDRAYSWVEAEMSIGDKEFYYNLISKGVCFGEAALMLQEMDKNPKKAPSAIAQSLHLDRIIYLQLRYILTPPTDFPNLHSCWHPIVEGNFAFNWKEQIKVFYTFEDEDAWVEFLSNYIKPQEFIGRVSFSANENGGHTFAFWHTNNSFGYLDNRIVEEFTESRSFCKAIRSLVLSYRQSNPVAKENLNNFREQFKQDKTQDPLFFPVAILNRPT